MASVEVEPGTGATTTTTPTGTVTFALSDGVTLGTVSLAAISSGVAGATLTTYGLPVTPGTYTLSISYSGDSTYESTTFGSTPDVTVEAATGPLDQPTGAGVSAPAPSLTSVTGVNYASGTIQLTRTDLTSNAFGSPFGQGWAWTNASGYSDGLSGTDGTQVQAPHLVSINSGSTIAVVADGQTAEFFDLYGGTYHARFADPATLTHDTTDGWFVETDGAGDSTSFYDFSSGTPTGRAGVFLSSTDAAGVVTSVTSWASGGGPAEIQQTTGSGSSVLTNSFVYTYLSSGVNAGLLSSVTQRQQVGTGAWQTVQSVAYTYYDGSETNGLAGELEFATTEDASGDPLGTTYYRYDTGGGGGGGVGVGGVGGVGGSGGGTGLLTMVVEPAGYAALVAALGTSVDSLTNDQVTPYAGIALTYYGSTDQVWNLSVDAGAGTPGFSGTDLEESGTYSYSYETNSAATVLSPNTWATEAVETLPDGNENIVYTNAFGEVLLKSYQEEVIGGGGDQWDTAYQYNAAGQLVLEATPSAVTGYSDSYPDLIGYSGGSATYLSSSSGLITAYTYGSSTTATTSTAGNVAGYLEEAALLNGTGGTPVPQEAVTYIGNTVGGLTFYQEATDTVYRNSNGTGAETTSYAYTFESGTNEVASVVTTLPAVTTAENGPGTATSTTTVYDAFGNIEWTKDADGYLDYTQTDPLTGAVGKQITDVNTADTGDFTNLPSGWTTPTGGGLELITTYEVDNQGRTIEETDPDGNVTYTVYDDAEHEVRVYPGWNSSTDTTTGPIQVTREDWADGYTETGTMSVTPHTTSGVPDGTETIADLQSLSRSYTDPAGEFVVAKLDYFSLAGLTYSTGVMGTVDKNFYETQYGFEVHGWLDEVVSPQGTITMAVYDGMGRIVSVWVGTDATPSSGEWSPTNNSYPCNMTEVTSYQYDDGGVGDGNLTQVTQYPGGGAANRVTDYWYDWRDRQVAEKDGVESTETDGVNRPLTVTTYDNLNEVTETQVYDGDGVTPSIVDGVLSLPSGTSADLRAQTVTSYDELGQVYETQVYDVSLTSGSVSSTALTTNNYYDGNGNLIAESAPGGVWTKDVYNGAGWEVMQYSTDGGSGTTYADASTVSGDIVLTQTQTIYDADGNGVESIESDRFDNATGTGALGTPTSGVEARVYYSASYYAAAGRDIADVDVGTNGGSAWTRPSSVPTASATVLVTSYGYAADALQLVQLTGSPTGGTFTLSFGGDTTSAIAYNASAATVQSDLQGLASIGSGNVMVEAAPGGGWQVQFTGLRGGQYQLGLTASGSGLTGGSSPGLSVAVLSAGGDSGSVFSTTDLLGLVSLSYSDALGQTTETVQDYTDGVVTDSSNKTTSYTYNGVGMTSLTAWLTGGSGETTAYIYGMSTASGSTIDSNDIVGITEEPDPTTGLPSTTYETTVTVNALGQTVTSTDPNGTTHTYSYDVLGRETADAVTTLGSGVDGSVRLITTAYDSQGNAYLTTSYSAVTGGSIVNQVEDVYNGLDQLTGEYQAVGGAVNTSTTPEVQYIYSEMAGGSNTSRLTGIVYPDGYTVDYNYGSGLDSDISRLTSLSDDTGTLETFAYLGLGTVVQEGFPEADLAMTEISQTGSTGDAGDRYTGLDRFGRVVEQLWFTETPGEPSTAVTVSDYQYGYDADGNVLWKSDGAEASFSEIYTYDGLNQLASFARGTLNSTDTGISGTASETESWTYDPVGNRTSDTTNGTTVTSTANLQNEVTGVSGSTTPTYDADGNMTTDSSGFQYVYNAWNQVVTVKNSSGTTLETETYDGLGREITDTVSGTTTDLYYSTSWQVLEQSSGGVYTTRYVWSPVYVNALVQRDTDTSGTGLTATGSGYQRLWAVQDANWNVVGLVNASQAVVERYAYDPSGTATVLTGSYGGRSSSSYGWVYLFQGGRLDGVTGTYGFEHRDLNTTLGRWTTMDPKRFAAHDVDLYRFVGNNPTTDTDPSGFLNLQWNQPGAEAGAVGGSIVGIVIGGGVGLAFDPVLLWPGIAIGFTAGAGIGYVAGGLFTDPKLPPAAQKHQGTQIGATAVAGLAFGPVGAVVAWFIFD